MSPISYKRTCFDDCMTYVIICTNRWKIRHISVRPNDRESASCTVWLRPSCDAFAAEANFYSSRIVDVCNNFPACRYVCNYVWMNEWMNEWMNPLHDLQPWALTSKLHRLVIVEDVKHNKNDVARVSNSPIVIFQWPSVTLTPVSRFQGHGISNPSPTVS